MRFDLRTTRHEKTLSGAGASDRASLGSLCFYACYDSRTDLIGISASHKWSWSGIVGPTHWKRTSHCVQREATAFEHRSTQRNLLQNATGTSRRGKPWRLLRIWPDAFLIVAAFRNGTIAIAGRLLLMTRDCWVELLRCPRCGKTGEAQISAKDQLSWNFRVDTIPHGFKVIRIDVDHC